MDRDINQLKENFNDLHRRYVSTDGKIDKILDILQGDDFAHGMIEAVKDHEVRIKKLEETNKKVGWTVGGALVAGGYGLFELVKKLFPFVAILLLFTGCITQKNREDIFHRHARENPADVLEYCEPPGLVYKPGRVDTIPGDTVYIQPDSVDCPDGTVIRPEPVAVPCPPSTRQVDTVAVRDMNEERRLGLILADKECELAVSEARREDAVKQSRGRLYWIIGLSVALVLAVVVRVKGLLT